MSVNGVTSSTAAYETSNSYSSKAASTEAAENTASSANAIDGEAAVYEASAKKETDNAAKTYKPNTEMVNKLKMEVEARTQQLQDIVNKLLSKQGQTYDVAMGLKQFYENLEVDDETREQAKKDIAEDGYWGVKATSERIFDFAKALSGGDPDKMEEMRKAFEKGFKEATKAWGDELPEISQKTKDAVNKLFDDYAASLKTPEEQV